MNEQEKKKVKVKLKLVAFSDLPKIKAYSFKEIAVGDINVGQRDIEREGEEKLSW